MAWKPFHVARKKPQLLIGLGRLLCATKKGMIVFSLASGLVSDDDASETQDVRRQCARALLGVEKQSQSNHTFT
jgi:hypothetical protein